MSVIHNASEEEDLFSLYGASKPKPGPCCMCGDHISDYPYAYWMGGGDFLFFCFKCNGRDGGLTRDLLELAQIAKRRRAIRDFHCTAVPPEERVYQ